MTAAGKRRIHAECIHPKHAAVSAFFPRKLQPGDRLQPLVIPGSQLAARCGVPALAVVKLQSRHGSNAEKVLDEGGAARILCRCEPVTEAELVYAARHEQVRTLADAFRRVGVAAGPCAGAACIIRSAEVVGRELGWSATQKFDAARDFLRGSWLGRAPVLNHSGWTQEELAQGVMRGLTRN